MVNVADAERSKLNMQAQTGKSKRIMELETNIDKLKKDIAEQEHKNIEYTK